jgi:hypothetical protein
MAKQIRNVAIVTDKGKLSLNVDLGQNLGPSSTGKTILIGTTGGNQTVLLPDGRQVIVSVNVYAYPDKPVTATNPAGPAVKVAS